MNTVSTLGALGRRAEPPHDRPALLAEALHAAAAVLPHQGPLEVFVHQNTLLALQGLPFHEAVARGAERHGARPYLEHAEFLALAARGRIEEADVEDALARFPPAAAGATCAGGRLPVERLARLLLWHLPEDPPPGELSFRISEQGLVERLRPDLPAATATALVNEARAFLLDLLAREGPAAVAAVLNAERREDEPGAEVLVRLRLPGHRDALRRAIEQDGERLAALSLWATCLDLGRRADLLAAPPPAREVRRHRDALLALTGEDIDEQVNPVLIRWTGAFLDLGVAHWHLPLRDQGLYQAFAAAYGEPGAVTPRWARGLRAELRRQAALGLDAAGVCVRHLDEMGVPPGRWASYLEALLLALPGWPGMVHFLEHHPEPSASAWGPPPRASLLDYVAVRLTLERLAGQDLAERRLAGRALPDIPLAPTAAPRRTPEQLAFTLFQVCQLAGLSTPAARTLTAAAAQELLGLLSRLDDRWRRGLLQEAYERRFRRGVLDALAAHRPADPAPSGPPPRVQIITCIDEREESLRRAFEEEMPACETASGPGFFGLAVDYQGLEDPRAVALCPVVVKPGHDAREVAEGEAALGLKRRRELRRLWARAVGRKPRSPLTGLLRGLLGTWALGWISAAPLVLRILLPRHASRLTQRAAALLVPRPRTRLLIEHGPELAPDPATFRPMSVAEQVERVGGFLENLGLARRLAKLVVVLGHGSTSLNNPHESAYHCGACGGRRGGPSARLFAQLANSPRVREGLAARGVHVPASTVFIGGMHDTCSDTIQLYDQDLLPPSHAGLLDEFLAAAERARAANAHERARRFDYAHPDWTPRQALHHVERRAVALDEPRPEYNHATNAMCIVGRRTLTRGLFLDRRAFLQSYDPDADPDGTLLERVLVPAGFVCAGINLEYFFSCVDNDRYGCGTKLPHNITGMVGVMDGHASDLRTGLSRQMIEVHEPMRLLLIVEATQERLLDIARRRDELRDIVFNRWIDLVSLDPRSGAMSWFDGARFVPYQPAPVRLPAAARSMDYYRGRRDHLPPARIAGVREAAHAG